MRHKPQMPRYYGTEIVRNAQRRFLKRKREETAKAAGSARPFPPEDKKTGKGK